MKELSLQSRRQPFIICLLLHLSANQGTSEGTCLASQSNLPACPKLPHPAACLGANLNHPLCFLLPSDSATRDLLPKAAPPDGRAPLSRKSSYSRIILAIRSSGDRGSFALILLRRLQNCSSLPATPAWILQRFSCKDDNGEQCKTPSRPSTCRSQNLFGKEFGAAAPGS